MTRTQLARSKARKPDGARRHLGVAVTDHAVIRFIERHHGVDVAAVRRRIAEIAAPGAQAGARSVNSDGLVFVIESRTVVTVKG